MSDIEEYEFDSRELATAMATSMLALLTAQVKALVEAGDHRLAEQVATEMEVLSIALCGPNMRDIIEESRRNVKTVAEDDSFADVWFPPSKSTKKEQN